MTVTGINRKLKVMLVTGWMHYGGLERVVISLWRHMDRTRFDPFIVCTAGRGAHYEDMEREGARMFALDGHGKKFGQHAVCYRLAQIARADKVDIVHTHNTGPMLDATLAGLFGRPGVMLHTDHARSFPDTRKYMIAENIAAHFFSKIVAVSEETKQNLIHYEGIPGEKITVINNGIEGASYDIALDRQEAKKQFGVERFKQIVGLGVVLTEQKGIIHLIRAASQVLAQHPDTGFVVAGDGKIREQLHNFVKKQGIADNFIFIGATKEIPAFLQSLDVYVLPSEWEGLPLVLLEAMAAKRCIVASAVGAVPQVITDGEEGLLVPPADPAALACTLVRVLGDSALQQKLADNAHRRFLQGFTVQAMVRAYERLYQEVADKKIHSWDP